MGYVFDFKDALAYEEWFYSPENKTAADLEGRLILRMLKPMHGRTLLDIGCGTGARLFAFLEKSLDVTGLDPSPYVLDIAKEKLKNRVDFHREFGESLPFDDNAFHYVSLINTLEFVHDTKKVIEEACRVAKDKIFIGIYNRYAVKWLQRRIKGIFTENFYNRAQFYSIWELKHMVRQTIGDVPTTWKTVCQFPTALEHYVRGIEGSAFLQRLPFGAFAGLVVTPVPRFRTTPLAYTVKAKHATTPSYPSIGMIKKSPHLK